MKPGAIIAVVIAAIAIAFGVYMVDIDVTEEARLPDVDVTVEGGNLPEVDAEVGSIAVTEENVTVTVPEVEVTTEEAELTVPGIEVTPPEGDADEETDAVAQGN